MYEEESVGVPPNFIPALKKYRWYLVIIIPILAIIATAIVVAIPPKFRSAGTVVVETQKIPEELVRSTVTSIASERIAIILQRVMTRDNLLEIVNRYEYFKPADNSEYAIERTMNNIRANIHIDVVETSTGSRSKPVNTIAFSVAFEARNPFVAQAVANDVMDLFLKENVKVRTQRASETTEFLRAEADKIKQSLDRTEAEVAKLKQENKDALPEHLELYVDMRERAQSKLNETERDIRSVREQKKLFESQLSLARDSGTGFGVEQSRLSDLVEQYERQLMTYKPEHPDMVALKEQIDMLSRAPRRDRSIEASTPLTKAEMELSQRLVDLEAREKSLIHERNELKEEIEDLESRIIRIPQVRRALLSLTRDSESKERQYNSIVAKTLDASMAESLEEGLKAERFSILERAVQPAAAYSPDRKQMLMMAMLASFGIPIGIVLGLGFLDKTVRDPGTLGKLTKLPVVVDVPYVPYPGEMASYRKALILNCCLALVVVVASVVVFHLQVMPIDVLTDKLIVRFSGG